jgi:hypothetical protein
LKRKFPCPNCGAPVREGSRSCRGCGSDAQTGWRDDDEAASESIEIPEEELSPGDYRSFLEREGLARRTWTRRFLARLLLVALLVLGLLLLLR